MIQTKATITGCIGAISLAIALLSPTQEITSADSLVGFASGDNVQTQTVQTNKGLMGLMFLAALGSAAWTLIGNDDEEAAAPVAQHQPPIRPMVAVTPAAVQASPPPIAGNNLNDFWKQDVEFSTLAQQFDIQTRSRLLKAALVAHEGGWILRLLYWPVLLVIGRPGSAKSSFAAAMGITREVLNPAIAKTVVTDPNAHLKLESGIWQAHWDLQGSRDNWKEIGAAISDMYRRFADSIAANNVSSIYDEVTTYKGNVDDKKLGGFLSQVTSKARACAEYITIVAHNDTLKALGGEAGEAKLKDDMAQLNLGSKATSIGKMVPTGTGSIEGLDVDEKNNPIRESVTLPRWFDPEMLSELFPELYFSSEAVKRGLTATDDDGKRYQLSRDLLPSPNRPLTDEANYLTTRAARTTAAVHLVPRIHADLGVLVEVSQILTAAEDLAEGKSDSHIIKEVLGCKGVNYAKGKAALELIKQTFTTTEG